jgi:hypothetical protein
VITRTPISQERDLPWRDAEPWASEEEDAGEDPDRAEAGDEQRPRHAAFARSVHPDEKAAKAQRREQPEEDARTHTLPALNPRWVARNDRDPGQPEDDAEPLDGFGQLSECDRCDDRHDGGGGRHGRHDAHHSPREAAVQGGDPHGLAHPGQDGVEDEAGVWWVLAKKDHRRNEDHERACL